MDLEEHTLEEMKESCELCGALLTKKEIIAAQDSRDSAFLCTVCASEELASQDDVEEYE